MQKTPIEWALNPDGTQGYTWNPVTGCLNNCPYCYARKLANGNGRLRKRYLENQNTAPNESYKHTPWTEYQDPFYPRFWEEKLNELYLKTYTRGRTTMLYGRKARGIFVCNMSDLFGKGIPESWTSQVMDAIRNDTVDRFYLLTKQPQNLQKYSPFPDNCRVGVSATDCRMAITACMKLGNIQAAVKYLSIEPFLQPINLPIQFLADMGISWLIIGAQTNPTVLPRIEWLQEIVEAADRSGIPVFLKNNLEPLIHGHSLHDVKSLVTTTKGEDGKYTWKLRQELP